MCHFVHNSNFFSYMRHSVHNSTKSYKALSSDCDNRKNPDPSADMWWLCLNGGEFANLGQEQEQEQEARRERNVRKVLIPLLILKICPY